MRFDSIWTLVFLLGVAGVLAILAGAAGLPAWWVPATVVVGMVLAGVGCRR